MRKSSFTKKEHLKKNSSISKVFDNGSRFRGRLITVFLLKEKTPSEINKAAFITRKHLYNKKTVLRNRFRRILKEAYRKQKHLLPPGFKIVLLATKVKKNTSAQEVEKDLINVFKKCSKI